MKVLKLRMEGFTCYRKATDIDFSELELFAITGSTGSGKSSLVDAIIFSLYGKVPRLGNDLTSLISQGLNQLKVLVEFEAGGEKYKVARKVQTKKTSQAILDLWNGVEWVPDCSGVRQVNQKIGNILGINYDAFTRCIVLPQGAFAQFLQDAKSRQDILIKLLGLEILAEMQKKASKKRDRTTDQIDQIEARLLGEFGEINPESIEKLKEKCEKLDEEIQSLQEKVESLRSKHDEALKLHELNRTLQALEKEYEQVSGQRNQIEELQKKIDIARKVLPILPHLDRYENLQNKKYNFAIKQRELDQQNQTFHNLQKKLKKEMEDAQVDYETLPDLEKRHETLQETKQLARQLNEKQQIFENEKFLFSKDKARQQNLEQQLKKLLDAIRYLKEHRETYEQKSNELEIKHKVLQKFHGAENLVQLLVEVRQTYTQSSQSLKMAVEDLENKKKQAQILLDKYCRQEALVKQLQEQLKGKEAKRDLEEELFTLEQAYHLVERLEEQKANRANEQGRLEQEKEKSRNLNEKLISSKEGLEGMLRRFREISEGLEKLESIYTTAQSSYEKYNQFQEKLNQYLRQINMMNNKEQEIATICQSLDQSSEELTRKKGKCRENLQVAKEELKNAQTQNMAHSIRQTLKNGEKCPVCSRVVKRIPKEEDQEHDIENWELKVEKIEEEMDYLERKLASVRLEFSHTRRT